MTELEMDWMALDAIPAIAPKDNLSLNVPKIEFERFTFLPNSSILELVPWMPAFNLSKKVGFDFLNSLANSICSRLALAIALAVSLIRIFCFI